ncbi:unnamed protein product [Dicrocoelium dendriticum]|nr:unnamed protein product [Dicrocoelium dendriticum]
MSTDGRWLISAHNGDSLIKTWDILNGRLIDCFRVSAPITSVALSPSNEFLATTHANSLGIHLWDNRGTYRRLHLQPLANNFVPPLTTRVTSVPSRSLVVSADGLRVGPDIHEDDLEGRIRELNEGSYTESMKEQALPTDSYMSPEQLPDQLPTLSGLSSVFLSNFLHLDVIRERNRLAASNTESDAMSSLPFFLPITETAKGLAWVDTSDAGLDVGRKQTPGKRRASVVDGTLAALEPVPGLGAQLVKAATDEEFDEIMRTLKTFGPSALDLEIRLLAPSVEEEKAICSSAVLMNGTPRERLHGFLRLLINRFERNMDVDLACVCLEGVLQRHGDLLLHPYNKSVEPTFHASGTLEQHLNELLSTRDRESNAVSSNATLSLVSHAILAKNKAANLLTRRLTRSICLIDFIRNPTTALHF